MSILAPGIFGIPEKVQELHEKYVRSCPYPHCNINPLSDRDFMRSVHDELTCHMKANFKETDLFKLFQTDELGTLDAEQMRKTMPNLLQLRTALYSKEFRSFVREVTGCGELTDRVDLSSNAYANSCHLLCHDDVIGTRRVSFILYLSDPDEDWHEEDGGAVELYPLDESSVITHERAGPQGVPTAAPSRKILPMFNSMLFFTVLPGRSYHSVQEVFAKDRPRLSISGWYHGPEPPVGSDKSSLRLIMSTGDKLPSSFSGKDTITKEDGLFHRADPSASHGELSAKDIKFLKQFVSGEYLSAKGIANIAEQFCDESSVQLHSFLTADWAERIFSSIVRLDEKDRLGKCRPALDYAVGVGSGWVERGPAHKRRYLAYAPEKLRGRNEMATEDVSAEVGGLLETLLHELFSSDPWKRYVRALTTCAIVAQRAELRRFRAGLDYTVAHYGCLTKEPRLDATLCFVNDDREAEQRVLRAGEGADAQHRKKKRKKERSTGSGEASEAPHDDGYDSDYAGVWEDGEVGAFECYIEADQDAENAEAAEVYKQDYGRPAAAKEKSANRGGDGAGEDSDSASDGEEESGEGGDDSALLSVSARHNSLSLVLRDFGLMKFIKFTSANSPGSRYDVSLEYIVEQTD